VKRPERLAIAARLATVAFLLAVSGCSKRIHVSVRDGETGEALTSGRVCVSNGRMDPLDFLPAGKSCDAIVRGAANVRWATRRTPAVTAASTGYLPWQEEFFGKTSGDGPVRLSVKLYRAPMPAVTLLVPSGFRGLIKTHFSPHPEGAANEAWRRDFVLRVVPEQVNTFAWPGVLRHLQMQDFRCRYDDRTDLSSTASTEPSTVALRYLGHMNLKADSPVQLFCIGTSADADAWRIQMPRHTAEVDMSWVEAFGNVPRP
jgi:hypothetical protein